MSSSTTRNWEGEAPAEPYAPSDNGSAGASPSLFARLALTSHTRPVWLRVGQLIDGVSPVPLRDANIVFDATQIRFVGTDGATPDPAHLAPGQSAPDATLSDHTLLPTLIEAHAHLFLDGAPTDLREREKYLLHPTDWMLARARARLPKILQSGIGAIRDAGDKHGIGLALSASRSRLSELARISSNGETNSDPAPPSPWIDSPGAAIHHRGRYGSFMAQPLEDHKTPADCVAARIADGAARIKLLVTGIINFKSGRVTAPPQMSAEEVAALVAAARHCGRQTFAHASGTDGIENAISGGVNTVEHGFFITPDQLARMRDRNIAWCPTFAPMQLQIDRAADLGHDATIVANLERAIAGHQEMLRHARQLGVAILAGSDAGSCGVPHALGLLEEMLHMQRAGLPPMAVIQSATAASARILNFPDRIGQVAAGFRPRMILTRHDPLATVANLRQEKTIFFDGHAVHCPADLDPAGL